MSASPQRPAARTRVLALCALVAIAAGRAGSLHAAQPDQPGTGARGRAADHVVLISVDGFRPEFYLDERWPAPMLQRMAREGAHARAVRGVMPTVTYPSHKIGRASCREREAD